MENCKRKTRFRSFSFRLFICIFTTAFVLLLAGSLILYSISMKETARINDRRLNETLNITASNINNVLGSCDETAQLSLSQENILSYLKNGYDAHSNRFLSIQHALVTAVASNNAACHISLFDSWGHTISTNSHSHDDTLPYDSLESCYTYLESYSKPQSVNDQKWYFLLPNPLSPSQFSMANVRKLRLLPRSETEPVLVVSLSENYISSLYSFAGADSYIVLDNGLIVSAVNKELIGTQISTELLQKIVDYGHRPDSLSFMNSYFQSVPVPAISAFLVVNVESSQSMNQTSLILLAVVITLIIGLFLSLAWAKYISSSLTKPIKEAKSCIEQVRNGKMDIRCSVQNQDEIGYLCESFNQMMDRLQIQIEENDRQQAITKDSELRLLHSQINPHLLYNCLDSALYMITVNDREGSVQTLEELSRYFKLSLQNGNNIVTLKDEIEHVKSYIVLQNLCRLKNYSIEFSGNPDLLSAKILHMLLQPIVENSVIHGFSGSFEDGIIKISYSREGSFLLVNVTDNGTGMEIKELEELRAAVSSPEIQKSFGLWNVAERIRMYYGENSTVSIDSESGEFTSVTIKIPYTE